MRYTKEQAEAIRHTERNQLTIACAGSGKSTVVASRVIKCLMREGVLPRNVVVLTYNNDAAASLKRRIHELASEMLPGIVGLAEMFIGTIHAFCLHLLQDEFHEFRKYTLASDTQIRLLISRNREAAGMDMPVYIEGDNVGNPLGHQDEWLFHEVLNTIREERISRKMLPVRLRNALTAFHSLLDRHALMDYSRVVTRAVNALHDQKKPENIATQSRIAARIKYLLVDEHQDVNPVQELLISRIHELGAYVTVVGDDDQLIYAFRGSQVSNIQKFVDRYPDVTETHLTANFRSSAGIVNTARSVIEALGNRRLPKEMCSRSHLAEEPGDLLALSFSSPDLEAGWIARKIRSMIGTPFQDKPGGDLRGLALSDFAVLVRRWREAVPIMQALTDANVEFATSGKANLLETAEANAVAISFGYLADQWTVQQVIEAWRATNLGLQDNEINRAVSVLDRFRAWDDEGQGTCCLQNCYLLLLGSLGVSEERAIQHGSEEVMYCLGRISRAIGDFQAIVFQTPSLQKFREFHQWLRYVALSYEDLGDDNARVSRDAVTISTVHKAKGLEWPAVFVPGLKKGVFPSRTRPSTRWNLLPPSLIENSYRYNGLQEDERRLFYVAITRGQKYLFCSASPWSADEQLEPSEFFNTFASQPPVGRSDTDDNRTKIESRARKAVIESVNVSITALKYFQLCQHQYKLRYVYGFGAPVVEELGFGRSLHDASAEIHKRAMAGESITSDDLTAIVDRHLNLPYATGETVASMKSYAVGALNKYLERFGPTLPQVVLAEKDIAVSLDGISINGRIDVVKRLEEGTISIVEQKTAKDAQSPEITRTQLHMQSLGYRSLTGVVPDQIETIILDEQGDHTVEPVDEKALTAVETVLCRAGEAIRLRTLPPHAEWIDGVCENCDGRPVCHTAHLRDWSDREFPWSAVVDG